MGWPSFAEDVESIRDALRHLAERLDQEQPTDTGDARSAIARCAELLERAEQVVSLAQADNIKPAARAIAAELEASRLRADLEELGRARDIAAARLATIQSGHDVEIQRLRAEIASLRDRLLKERATAEAKLTKANAEAEDARRTKFRLRAPGTKFWSRRVSKAPRTKSKPKV